MSFCGSHLRNCRRDSGMTMDQLAERSGYSKSSICEIESGRTVRPSAHCIFSLASALSVPAERLLGMESSEHDTLVAMFRGLSQDDQATVYRIMDSLARNSA